MAVVVRAAGEGGWQETTMICCEMENGGWIIGDRRWENGDGGKGNRRWGDRTRANGDG